MGRRLYVGNLSYSVTEKVIESTFSAHGTVESVKLIVDRDTGRNKGFAFVEMGTDAEAAAAVAQLQSVSLEGRPMNVNEAKPQVKRSSSGSGGRGRW